NDCRYYYVCAFGNKIHLRCAKDFVFDPTELKCVPLGQGDCDVYIFRTSTRPHEASTPAPSSQKSRPVTAFPRKNSSRNGHQGDRKCILSAAHYRIIDPKDCRYYYLCYYGVPIHEKCPYNFEFSPKIMECLAPSLAKCNTTATTPTPATTTTHKTTTAVTTTVSPKEICQNEDSFYSLVPDPTSCRNYYYCFLGFAIRDECQNGYEFDPTLLACIPKSESTCKPTESKSQGWSGWFW
ncbi:uncharacterized protein LOC119192893, partial [Manduca sexta]|uniref:uncharacterized protein LOC119192893 n=1 Tax=Manduca sexta TaxID=7130 RepID=UPI00188FF646